MSAGEMLVGWLGRHVLPGGLVALGGPGDANRECVVVWYRDTLPPRGLTATAITRFHVALCGAVTGATAIERMQSVQAMERRLLDALGSADVRNDGDWMDFDMARDSDIEDGAGALWVASVTA